MSTALRRAKRWLYLTHRWMGIVGCLMFAVWFASGMVMMYVAYPELTREEHLAGLPAITWDQVQLTPDAALAQAGLQAYPKRFVLEMMADEPVYRINGHAGERVSISAHNGHRIEAIDAPQALKIASIFSGGQPATLLETLERDQWTVPQNLDPLRPLHKIALNDADGTELYVSARNGEVLRDTTRAERFWNWLGSVPHWIYFTPLRANQPLWRQVNLWVSGIVMIVPVTGLLIGILRWRWRRPYVNGRRTPYRGWQKWHHIVGLIGGVFLLLWIISGWLSVNPNRWFAERSLGAEARLSYSGHVAPSFVENLPAVLQSESGIKEARFVWIAGQPRILITEVPAQQPARTRLINGLSGLPVSLQTDELFNAAQKLLPEAQLVQREALTQEDAYWYGHHDTRPLPVLRARFNDTNNTQIYLDPKTGALLGQLDDSDRIQRWLFNGLHRNDYLWLIHNRPLWDVLVIALLLAGLAISCSGIVIGVRRLRHS